MRFPFDVLPIRKHELHMRREVQDVVGEGEGADVVDYELKRGIVREREGIDVEEECAHQEGHHEVADGDRPLFHGVIFVNCVYLVPVDVGRWICLIDFPILQAKPLVMLVFEHLLADQLDLFKGVVHAVSILEGDEGDAEVPLLALLLDLFHLFIDFFQALSVVLLCVYLSLVAGPGGAGCYHLLVLLPCPPSFDLLQLFLQGDSLGPKLVYVGGRLEQLYFEDVGCAKSQREHFLDSSLCLLDAYICVDAVDHNRMQLDKLIKHLLIRLEFEL